MVFFAVAAFETFLFAARTVACDWVIIKFNILNVENQLLNVFGRILWGVRYDLFYLEYNASAR